MWDDQFYECVITHNGCRRQMKTIPPGYAPAFAKVWHNNYNMSKFAHFPTRPGKPRSRKSQPNLPQTRTYCTQAPTKYELENIDQSA